jgi:hypothetical protein
MNLSAFFWCDHLHQALVPTASQPATALRQPQQTPSDEHRNSCSYCVTKTPHALAWQFGFACGKVAAFGEANDLQGQGLTGPMVPSVLLWMNSRNAIRHYILGSSVILKVKMIPVG